MDIKSIANKVKGTVDKRGGTEALKEDAGELKDIASGQGSLADKAKKGAGAIKEPGARTRSREPRARSDLAQSSFRSVIETDLRLS